MAALLTDAGWGHEPFQITTEARVLASGVLLHVTLASRTATLACPGAVGAVRSLTPDDFERRRVGLEACARELYVLRSAGGVLAPITTVVGLTEEGDFDARLRYPAAAPGALTFDAVHLARLPDATYGAELTVTSEREFLGQALLRATAPAFTVQARAGEPVAVHERRSLRDAALVVSLLAVAALSVHLLRRRA